MSEKSDPACRFPDTPAAPHWPVALARPGEAFAVLAAGGDIPALLVCDHATAWLPEDCDGLGVEPTALHRHVALDIGAAALTRGLCERLGLCGVFSCFSRLLIDPNRPPDDPTLIPEVTDDVVVPGNRGLDAAEIERRFARFYRPYHAAIAREIERFQAAGVAPAIISIHSFTPVMRGRARPWQVGVLWNRDDRLARPILERLRAPGDLKVGDNEPYSGRIAGYCLDHHGGARGLPHVAFEVRQDLIDTWRGVSSWVDRLSAVLADVLADRSLFVVRHY